MKQKKHPVLDIGETASPFHEEKNGAGASTLSDEDTQFGAGGVTLSCVSLGYSVLLPDPNSIRMFPPKVEKSILRNITCEFRPGESVAIMGPSGAGKSTFLMALAGHNHATGHVSGLIQVNGEHMPANFKELSSFVPQDDVLMAGLTPREMLSFTAALTLDSDTEGRKARVRAVLRKLNIEVCADTAIGNVDKKGISGGQRKRVSIGMELLRDPKLMFVDEGTTGLDSKSAEDVVEAFQVLAKMGRTIMVTIHQPSRKIFDSFDGVVLMAKGSVVYAGPTVECMDYFSKEGLEVPLEQNPSDQYMEWLQDPTILENLLGHSSEHEDPPLHAGRPSLQGTELTDNRAAPSESSSNGHAFPKVLGAYHTQKTKYPISKWKQTIILFYRDMLNRVKDPAALPLMFVRKLFMGFLPGLCFVNISGFEQEDIYPMQSSIFFGLMIVASDTLYLSITDFQFLKALVLREYRNGHYCTPAFGISYALSVNLFVGIGAFLQMTPMYLLIGFRRGADHVFAFVFYVLLLTWTMNNIGLLAASMTKNIATAKAVAAPLILPFTLFSGFFIPYDDLPEALRFLYYLSPFQYGLSLILIGEFHERRFTDCDPSVNVASLDSDEVCDALRPCFETGDDYLEDVNVDADDISRDVLVLLATAFGAFVFFYFGLRSIVRG